MSLFIPNMKLHLKLVIQTSTKTSATGSYLHNASFIFILNAESETFLKESLKLAHSGNMAFKGQATPRRESKRVTKI